MDQGNLAHSLMEALAADSNMELDAFLEMADSYFERFLMEKPALAPKKIEIEKTRFREMMANAFHMEDAAWKMDGSEVKLQGNHEPTGIKLGGRMDRLEQNREEESYRIVDFKTGNNPLEKKKDFDKAQDSLEGFLQPLIYAYLAEKQQKKINVGNVEFRYIKLNKRFSHKYDEGERNALTEKLKKFKSKLENCEFPITEVEKNCKNCKYGSICGKKIMEDTSDD